MSTFNNNQQQQQQQHLVGNSSTGSTRTGNSISRSRTGSSSTSNSNSNQSKGKIIKNTIRNRDIIAIGIVLVLTKLNWFSTSNNNNNNTSSSIISFVGNINLQWYIPRHISINDDNNISNNNSSHVLLSLSSSTSTSRLTPITLDIDGDGISETIVSITQNHIPNQHQHDDDDEQHNNRNKNTNWIIQVVDMKPIIHHTPTSTDSSKPINTNKVNFNKKSTHNNILYRPNVLLQSEPIVISKSASTSKSDTDTENNDNNNHERFVPLDFISSHVPIRYDYIKNRILQKETFNKSNETSTDNNSSSQNTIYNDEQQQRTIHYFCGIDWHDAATKCTHHCPTGIGCPNGQRCYADTPCTASISSTSNETNTTDNHHQHSWNNHIFTSDTIQTTTPGGGIPSIFTLWSNGSITMHSIIVIHNDNNNSNDTSATTATKKRQSKKDASAHHNKLQLKHIWTVQIPTSTTNKDINNNKENQTSSKSKTTSTVLVLDTEWSSWSDVAIQYIDSYNANNGAGIIIVTGTATFYEQQQSLSNVLPLRPIQYKKKLLCTINVLDGIILWNTIEIGVTNNHGTTPVNDNENNSENNNQEQQEHSIDPLYQNLLQHRGYDSTARRRSIIPSLEYQLSESKYEHDELVSIGEGGSSSRRTRRGSTMLDVSGNTHTNCLKEYKYSILTSNVLPHYYYSEEDTIIQTVHFEHSSSSRTTGGREKQKRRRTKQGVQKQQQQHQRQKRTTIIEKIKNKVSTTFKKKQEKSSNQKQQRRQQQQQVGNNGSSTSSIKKNNNKLVKYGKPNVIIIHDSAGVQVRSLKNGKPICHLSLTPQLTYADINHDGIIDIISAVVHANGQNELLRTNDDDRTTTSTNNKKMKNSAQEEPIQNDDEDDDRSNTKRVKHTPWNDAMTIKDDQKEWIRQLVQQQQKATTLSSKKAKAKTETVNEESIEEEVDDSTIRIRLCHILALSGIPAREQLFFVNLCGKNRYGHHATASASDDDDDTTNDDSITSTAPLLVESLSHGNHRSMYDIITAVNNGVVTRINGITGKVEWQSIISHTTLLSILSTKWNNMNLLSTTASSSSLLSETMPVDELDIGLIPTGDDPNLITLQQINVHEHLNDDENDDTIVAAQYRPILWTGEDSMILLSPINGNVISYVQFPQNIVVRSVIQDFNGDGTSDVIIVTNDAIWGYQIIVHIQTSYSIIIQRIMYGVVVLLLLLSVLLNQIQSQPGKRFTDG